MLSLRSCEPRDYDAVWALHHEALDGVGANAGPGPWDDDLRDIEKVYLHAGGDFLVGECDGAVVAMGALRRTGPDRAEIRRMRVSGAHQRRGFGRQLLEALERRALALGCTVVHLDTTSGQAAARRFYESAGYHEVGRGSEGRFEVIFYEKRLTREEREPGPAAEGGGRQVS